MDNGLWVIVCVVGGGLGFLVGRFTEKKRLEAAPHQKQYSQPDSNEEELPLKSSQIGDKKEVEFLRDQLRKERDMQRKTEEQFKAEIKQLNAQIRDLSKARQTQKQNLKRKEETRDLLNAMDQELQDRSHAADFLRVDASGSLDDAISRELES